MTAQTQTKFATVLLTLVVGLMTVGCGPNTGGRVPLAGEVTLDGAPLDHGTIEFHGSGGSSVTGGQITDGKFEIPAVQGVMPGDYQVKIYSAEESEVEVDPEAGPGPEAEQHVAAERIPPRYNSETELTAQVGEEGATELKFDLQR